MGNLYNIIRKLVHNIKSYFNLVNRLYLKLFIIIIIILICFFACYDSFLFFLNDFYSNFSFNQNKNSLDLNLTKYKKPDNQFIIDNIIDNNIYKKNICSDSTTFNLTDDNSIN